MSSARLADAFSIGGVWMARFSSSPFALPAGVATVIDTVVIQTEPPLGIPGGAVNLIIQWETRFEIHTGVAGSVTFAVRVGPGAPDGADFATPLQLTTISTAVPQPLVAAASNRRYVSTSTVFLRTLLAGGGLQYFQLVATSVAAASYFADGTSPSFFTLYPSAP